mgnify:CR=1 FL=1
MSRCAQPATAKSSKAARHAPGRAQNGSNVTIDQCLASAIERGQGQSNRRTSTIRSPDSPIGATRQSVPPTALANHHAHANRCYPPESPTRQLVPPTNGTVVSLITLSPTSYHPWPVGDVVVPAAASSMCNRFLVLPYSGFGTPRSLADDASSDLAATG